MSDPISNPPVSPGMPPPNHRRGTGCQFGPPLNGRICTCPALPAKEETPTWLNPKKLANDAVQRLADSEPTEDSIEGMERLRGTSQESMFVVNAAELQRVIECTLEDALYDSRSSQPSSSSEIRGATGEFDALLDQYGKACSEDWVADALRYKEGLRRVYREQLQEIERLKETTLDEGEQATLRTLVHQASYLGTITMGEYEHASTALNRIRRS